MTDTLTLICRSQGGDRDASEQLISENSGLIWSVAKRFLGRGAESEDLYQLGCLGFLKAVEGYDPEYGTQFSTYAVPKIAGEIRRYIRDDGAVKVSRTLKERALQIKMIRNQYLAQKGVEPSVLQLSEITGYTIEDIAIAESVSTTVESIYQNIGEEGFCLEDVLTDTESEERMVERIALKQAIDRLGERESMVIKLRYYHGLTQDRVSKILNVSQVQVSRLEKKAIEQMKEILS